MLRPRVIPCLLVQNGGLVKTVAFKDPKYVGDPINAVRIFNEKEADELAVFDIDATTHNAEPDFKMVARLAAECRMPLCYGGGVKTAEQARRIVGLGVEKVAISSAAIETPDLISQSAREIGGQSVVVVVDARLDPRTGQSMAWTHNGTRTSGRTVIDVAQQAEALGAGEIVVNSIDRDGMMRGYDLALAKTVRQAVGLPITLLGGAGSLADIKALVDSCGVVGAAVGSLFVFKGAYRAVLINYPAPQKKDELFLSA
ncbi:AglZ/HisF2 family acetamidino modification protein [Bradyrhizobium sp.]|uniref:AglZ/HisF2 family acetamidino modification protein n=1 Tax=Bradyrhizobium sp. TaxID=376 RepID=UPI00403796CC